MRRKKKKKQQDEAAAGAPEWIVTFTDMISLLVTFFVLMMTYSSMEDYDRLKIDGLLDSSRSPENKVTGNTVLDAPEFDVVAGSDLRRGATTPHTRPVEELPDNIDEMGQKLLDDHLALDLSVMSDGLRIQFDEDCGFAPGSTEVSPALVESLRELGRVLEHYPFLVVVEGFTDTGFQPTDRHPDAEALSVARARAAATVMFAESGLSPRLLQIAGLGTERPVAPNDDALERSKNRRVEVRVLSLSRARAAHIKAERLGGS
jgi:chemotaxis protein MotB